MSPEQAFKEAVIELMTGIGRRLAPGAAVGGFRVQHQPVHVQDDGGKRWQGTPDLDEFTRRFASRADDDTPLAIVGFLQQPGCLHPLTGQRLACIRMAEAEQLADFGMRQPVARREIEGFAGIRDFGGQRDPAPLANRPIRRLGTIRHQRDVELGSITQALVELAPLVPQVVIKAQFTSAPLVGFVPVIRCQLSQIARRDGIPHDLPCAMKGVPIINHEIQIRGRMLGADQQRARNAQAGQRDAALPKQVHTSLCLGFQRIPCRRHHQLCRPLPRPVMPGNPADRHAMHPSGQTGRIKH